MQTGQESISFKTQLHLKSATLWLKLGEPMRALEELQQVSPRERRLPAAMDVCRLVYRAVSEGLKEFQ